MIKYYQREGNGLTELQDAVKGCWINISPPFDHENLRNLCNRFDVPFDFLIDSLDINERSRFEREDGIELIVLKTPLVNDVETDIEAEYITIPIGIILSNEVLITISAYENRVLANFLSGQVKNVNPLDRSKFVLKIFERNVHYFTYFLNEIKSKSNEFERQLYHSSRNEELAKMLNLQKSLTYILTSLRSNEIMMMKIKRMDFLNISQKEDETDMLEDILVDNSQALEMANIYTNILSGTMDAFASIINNNLNNVMKRLTSVTIVLMVPTLVASFYGMNVAMPFETESWAFTFTLVLSIGLAAILVFFFLRKRWF